MSIRGCAACLLALLLGGAWPLHAQSVEVRGRVLSVADTAALSGASVEILGTYWSARTAPDGSFRLRAAPGTWRLLARHVGFRPDTVVVALDGMEPVAPVSIRLAPQPVQLRGLVVEAPGAAPLAQVVTAQTIRQVPPLLEPDVFRAVVMMPAVSQPNDLKGRIHLAGGASDETGVRLDGHPLQDPFHLLGLLGAFNVAALERANVLIHHVPVAEDGRLSGVIDLESRLVEEKPRNELVTSVLSSGLTTTRTLPLGFDLLASGRITYLDRFVGVAGRFTDRLRDVPLYRFGDGLLRVGRSFGSSGWRIEALGFHSRDRVREPLFEHIEGYESLNWGESLLGVRVQRHTDPWRLDGRIARSRASAGLDELPAGGSNMVAARRDWWSAAAQVARIGRTWRWSSGAALDVREHAHEWVARGLADEIFSRNTPTVFAGADSQAVLATFGEVGWHPGVWSGTAGVRVSGALEGSAHLAPRVVIRYEPSATWRAEGALERRHQHDAQLEEPIEGSISPPMFLLDRPRTADVAALAANWRVRPSRYTDGATVRLESFAKRYPDRTLLRDFELGESRDVAPADFPAFLRRRGYSVGAAFSAQVQFLGEGTLQGSYTYQRVREQRAGKDIPATWDAPHALSLFTSVPLARRWTVNAAYQGHSGRATTPVLLRVFAPGPTAPPDRGIRSRFILGEQNSIRVPSYQRLDLGTRYSWGRSSRWVLSVQVLNVLLRTNAIDYDWAQYFSTVETSGGNRGSRPGLPMLPTVGLEVSW
ncbi:MAG TPA: carboxypeptidase regulatory-like domain-containing protein [Gemmatimonadaceae bacterium]|nr:carboxypeptidase regulatory-like domain-containing protein [Gemmatimonadaceae bacterium]